jgi:hypothetical protein
MLILVNGSIKGVKSFVGSYWLLLKPSLACLAPDEIQFAELFTMS